MEVARQGIFKVVYNGKDITSNITPYLSSVSYTDREEGFADDVTITLDNSSFIWFEDWYPTEGDTLQLFIGYQNQMVDCGLFEVDEIVLSGVPDMIEIKALSAGISKDLRTKNSKAFENLTLRQIANFFAVKHNLKLVDTSNMLNQINLDRKTQENITDLKFLSDLAKEYGFLFSIKSDQLIFISYYDLDNTTSIKSIDKIDVSNYTLTHRTSDTYGSGYIRKREPKTGAMSKWEAIDVLETKKTDKAIFEGRFTNKSQAQAKVNSGLYNKNKFKQSGKIDVGGDPSMIAGINFDLTGLGLGSGKYHIAESNHTISGNTVYGTSLTIRKTGTLPKPQRVPKPPKQEVPTTEETAYKGTEEEQ